MKFKDIKVGENYYYKPCSSSETLVLVTILHAINKKNIIITDKGKGYENVASVKAKKILCKIKEDKL